MDPAFFAILAGAFVTGFVALNLHSAGERVRALLVALSVCGAMLLLGGVPRLQPPWSTIGSSGYALACLATLGWTFRGGFEIEPRRVAFAAGEAGVALAVTAVVVSFA